MSFPSPTQTVRSKFTTPLTVAICVRSDSVHVPGGENISPGAFSTFHQQILIDRHMNNHFDEELSGEMSCDEEGDVNKVPKQRSIIVRLFSFIFLVVGSVVSWALYPLIFIFLLKYLIDRFARFWCALLGFLAGQNVEAPQPISWKHPFNPLSWSKTVRRVIGAIILIPSILFLILGLLGLLVGMGN